MDSQNFIEYCRAELVKSFSNSKAGSPNEMHKHRTEGLLQAAKLLGVMSDATIRQLVEEEHQKVFGETVAQRKARKAAYANVKEGSDAYFNIPAIERRS